MNPKLLFETKKMELYDYEWKYGEMQSQITMLCIVPDNLNTHDSKIDHRTRYNCQSGFGAENYYVFLMRILLFL